MAISISIPCCNPCIDKVFKWLEKKVGYTRNLKKNLVALEKTLEELKARRVDLSTTRGGQRSAEFQLWLDRVEIVEQEVNHLRNARDVQLQRLCLSGFCSNNLGSSYRYGRKVVLVLREVEELKIRAFNGIADQAKTHVVDERQLQPIIADQAQSSEVEERQLQPIIVGQEIMLEKAWKHLMKDEVGIMGMYGMGGVGKTTLLTQINNKFSHDKGGYDFVIWVVVSQEFQIERIQDNIAQKVGLGGEEWNRNDRSKKADLLFNFLKKKRFVLFLDDIWEKVDLAEIGVPDPRTQKGCKVAFTTRSQEVCARMGVEDPMEVECLAENEAFDLFQKKVGQVTLGKDPGIPGLARIVAKKCCGLPLALNVIGETMSCKRTIEEWQHAIDVLNSYSAEFSGMKDKILPLLKYSYDSLKGDEVKSCLLYCALFPEDYRIPKEKLIEYLIGEGIIDGSEGIEKAENKGYDIIGSLVHASLLMEGVQAYVHMHDVVREMALWIASDLGKQKEAFIVRAGVVGLSGIPKIKNWKVVRRMLLMNNNIKHLDGSPKCLVLTTLLLQKNEYMSKISNEFFKSMPKLAVLDLSGNMFLYILPKGISNLVSLQYLNLSRTAIHHLSKSLGKLKKLIHLDLEETSELQSIVGISRLQNLKVLKLLDSGLPWDLDIVKELEALEHLEVLTIYLNFIDNTCLEPILNSQRLMSPTRSLCIRNDNRESYGISLPEYMVKLRELNIFKYRISEIKMGTIFSFSSLVNVTINSCHQLRELTFLMFAPNLRSLYLYLVYDLEDIINKEKASQVGNSCILPFQKLSDLGLLSLRNLKSIYWTPLPFPCLEHIIIEKCPYVKKLPLDSKSGKQGDNGLIITYNEQSWIEGVEWEDEATKTRFLPYLNQICITFLLFSYLIFKNSNCFHL